VLIAATTATGWRTAKMTQRLTHDIHDVKAAKAAT
jgi:hypothetical protein